MTQALREDADIPERAVGPAGIPIRNVWLLYLYAYDLAQFRDHFTADIEASPDLVSLIARLLAYATEKRLHRNLSFGYRAREAVLPRVRGRIDLLKTLSLDLLHKGEIACRYQELTIDTPRNRFVRAALEAISRRVTDIALKHRCNGLAMAMAHAGVGGRRPTRAELSADQIARHQADDRLMVALARIAFDLVLPTEDEGDHYLLQAQRAETEFRKLFEKAVANFYAVELAHTGQWRVTPGRQLHWQVTTPSAAVTTLLPTMITDIVLENALAQRRIIIDTKFTNILGRGRFADRFKSAHIYQLYAYLRSQESDVDPLSLTADGILLYPAIGVDIDETAHIQGHTLRFATVDLAAPTSVILERLASLTLAK